MMIYILSLFIQNLINQEQQIKSWKYFAAALKKDSEQCYLETLWIQVAQVTLHNRQLVFVSATVYQKNVVEILKFPCQSALNSHSIFNEIALWLHRIDPPTMAV